MDHGRHDDALGTHLDILFPKYAGDRTGLLRTLTEDELKRAYRRQALECHPDRSGGGLRSDRFVRLREAFEALRPHAVASPPADDASASEEIVVPRPPTVVAVGGAKGGIGKSTLSASTATALANLGYRVVAIDMDLGGAGLHLFLGVRTPAHTLGHWWHGGTNDLTAALHPTEHAMLSLIAGDASVLGSTNINHGQKQKLLRQIHRLPADFVVLDLGGDTSFNTLDFFLFADHRLVVTTADPASVLEAYSFIKVALLRRLAQYVGAEATRPRFAPAAEARLRQFVADCRQPGAEHVSSLVAALPALDPEAGSAVATILREVRPRLVLNLSDPTAGKEIIERIRDACQQHLRIDVDLCHLVPADARVAQATRRITNVIASGSDGQAGQAVWALAHKLARPDSDGPAAAATPRRPTVRRRFFDPPAVFARLARLLDEPFRRARVRGESVEAFVVAADAGETAYSVAIALEDAARRTPGVLYHVWAGGVPAGNLEAARRGVYPHVFLGALRAETLRNHFLRGTGLSEGFSAVKDGVRRTVTFLDGPARDHTPHRPTLDLVFADGSAETLALVERGTVKPGGLVVVAGGSERDAPVPGLRRVDESIYQVVERPQSHRSVA
jgi:flagellar biosynthesis protein FlhG